MRNELGEVRRSQVITSHGPGSLIDFRAGSHGGAGVSVVAAGLEEWDRWAPPPGIGNPQTIFEPRLQKQLDVEGFRLPPVAPQIAPGQHSPESRQAGWRPLPPLAAVSQLSSDWRNAAVGRGSRGPGALLCSMH